MCDYVPTALQLDFLYGPYSPISPAAPLNSPCCQTKGNGDTQSYLQFDASKFEEEHDAILCSIYENQSQVSIMSPPSSPGFELFNFSETATHHEIHTPTLLISSDNRSNDDVPFKSAVQRDAISLASPRFLEQPDLQSIPTEEIPSPFPFNQEEFSKIDEILKLQHVQEIPIIKKKRHGRRGKRLGKISENIPRIAKKQPRKQPILQPPIQTPESFQKSPITEPPRRSSRISEISQKNSEENSRQEEMGIAGNPLRHEDRFKIVDSAIRKKDGEVCFLVEWISQRTWNTAKEMKLFGPRKLFQASQAKLTFY